MADSKTVAPVKGNLAEFNAAQERRRPRGCAIKFLPLTDQQRADLEVALEAPHVASETVADVVNGWKGVSGEPLSRNIVQRHREKHCGCFTAPPRMRHRRK